YIVVGATLEINVGQTDQEFVTVSAVTATTFAATFAKTHSANFTIGDTVTLTQGTDYTLGSAANGNTTINFIKIPANGTTISTTYTFAGGPAAYALEAKGSANPADTSLNGIDGLTLNASNLLVRARKGLDTSTASGLPVIHTSGGDVTL